MQGFEGSRANELMSVKFSELHELEEMYMLHADSRGLSLQGVRPKLVEGKSHYDMLERVLPPPYSGL